MISIVTVYNDRQILDGNLLGSLKDQTAKFQLIKLDNINNRFKSMAEALNRGGSEAKGKYIMFVHQDVKLANESWLDQVEKILDGIRDLGVAGCAGMNVAGEQKGFIDDNGQPWGKPLDEPEVVQTLDECLLIIPKKVFDQLQFDAETFDGWHGYGADYSLMVKEMGLTAYAIPAFIHHYSTSSRKKPFRVKGLFEAQKKLIMKHEKKHKYIYMTCGFLPISLRFLLNPKLIIKTYWTFRITKFIKLATILLSIQIRRRLK